MSKEPPPFGRLLSLCCEDVVNTQRRSPPLLCCCCICRAENWNRCVERVHVRLQSLTMLSDGTPTLTTLCLRHSSAAPPGREHALWPLPSGPLGTPSDQPPSPLLVHLPNQGLPPHEFSCRNCILGVSCLLQSLRVFKKLFLMWLSFILTKTGKLLQGTLMIK